ncbi:MAG TPA: DUF4325 domain-containing protein [Terrimesophilobacter sp.]|nr:DUF4325 domain-containing protein [Terrimesophilobacter sp.]
MRIYASVGTFAGDKDAAAHIRDTYLKRQLEQGNAAILDFRGVELATQSFIHALVAAAIRSDASTLDLIEFKNCNETVREIIQIVVDYAQDDFGVESDQ